MEMLSKKEIGTAKAMAFYNDAVLIGRANTLEYYRTFAV